MREQPAQSATTEKLQLSIIIPAYNEAGAIVSTLKTVSDAVQDLRAEIVVVDDGSTDGTAELATKQNVRVISLDRNSGYGFALKTGIASTDSDYVAILDADGTYPADQLPVMFEACQNADMIVGNRGAAMTNVPLVRRPAKWVLNKLATVLARKHIPDLNSGLRVFKRSSLLRFIQLLPDGFSFTTTITMSMLCSNLRVIYMPIKYGERIGSSKIRPADFFAFILLVLRIMVLFKPLSVFVPLGTVLFLLGSVKALYDVFLMNLSESAIFALLAALIVWSLGLIADMISRLHLRPPT